MTPVRYSSHLSTHPDTSQAVEEVCQAVADGLEGAPPTLTVVFSSPHHHGRLDSLPAALMKRLNSTHLIGCTGESIVGKQREVEEEPALSLWAAHVPDLKIQPFHVMFEQDEDDIALHGWPEITDTEGQAPVVLLIPEPFSSMPQMVLEKFEEEYPGASVVGGVASGGQRPGKNRLFLNNQAYENGVVGMLLWGPVEIRTIVSQGCRPIGRHLVVTKGQHNVIQELSGKPAFEQFQQIFLQLKEEEQQLARRALHIGCVINEYQEQFSRGDFLVRNIMGIDQNHGSIAITEHVRVGQTIQFHVRDAATASEDLQLMLAQGSEEGDVAGALLFTCNGRGTRMFEAPNHDALQIKAELGDVPLAGFFAQGEIGPIGTKSFLHGFSASMVLFGSTEAP